MSGKKTEPKEFDYWKNRNKICPKPTANWNVLYLWIKKEGMKSSLSLRMQFIFFESNILFLNAGLKLKLIYFHAYLAN